MSPGGTEVFPRCSPFPMEKRKVLLLILFDVIELKKNGVYRYRNFDVSVTVVNVPKMGFPVIDCIVYGVSYGYIRGNVRGILELTRMHIL